MISTVADEFRLFEYEKLLTKRLVSIVSFELFSFGTYMSENVLLTKDSGKRLYDIQLTIDD